MEADAKSSDPEWACRCNADAWLIYAGNLEAFCINDELALTRQKWSVHFRGGQFKLLQMTSTHDEGLADIAKRIRLVRGQRVLIDMDLAALYGVTTKRLNEQVRRNIDRFPADFVISLTNHDVAILRSQFATSRLPSERWGGRRSSPLAFTEHGAIMAATVLNSQAAVEMSILVVRAFVKLRQILASSAALAHRLESLERSVAALDTNTRQEFVRVYKAILKLMGPAPAEQ